LVRKVPPVSDLELHEAEMAEAEAEALARLRVAVAWHRAADRELTRLTRPTWGGPVVDGWHRAAKAVVDATEAVAAFNAFPPYTV
jgi:hypothetical protein